MANITEEHLHHMARRHHATMKKLDGIREQSLTRRNRLLGSAETTVGAWLGGAIEGRTSGGTVPLLGIPINLGIGALLLVVGHFDLAGDKFSSHVSNVGDGFIGSYAAATGYAFGKRWHEKGKAFGGGGNTWEHPYVDGGPAPAVHGDLSEGQMAAIVHRMQQAAAAPSHP